MIKRVSFAGLMVLALVLVASCGKDAKKAIDEAQTAVTAAKDAGAEQYAPDEYRGAEELLNKAKGEYDGRDYQPAQADAVSAKSQAELAKQRALDRKAEEDQKGAERAKAEAETTVAYNAPSLSETPVPIEDQAKAALKDISFAYDSSDLDDAARELLVNNAQWLKNHPGVKLQIEGHCDERGSEDYNLALGERRAKTVRDYLVSLGVEPSRLSIISYGESVPLDSGNDDAAWAKNRRAHFALVK